MAPLVALGTAIVLDFAFSAEASPQRPRGFWPVSIYSMSFSMRKENIKVLFSKTTTSISLRRRTFLMLELNEISVRFFLS